MTFIRTCYILVTLGHKSKIRLIYNNGNAFYSYKIGTMCNYNHPMIGLWAYTNNVYQFCMNKGIANIIYQSFYFCALV